MIRLSAFNRPLHKQEKAEYTACWDRIDRYNQRPTTNDHGCDGIWSTICASQALRNLYNILLVLVLVDGGLMDAEAKGAVCIDLSIAQKPY